MKTKKTFPQVPLHLQTVLLLGTMTKTKKTFQVSIRLASGKILSLLSLFLTILQGLPPETRTFACYLGSRLRAPLGG
jgi:hypothetical protein